MKKIIGIAILLILLVAAWMAFANTGDHIVAIQQQIEANDNLGDPNRQNSALNTELVSLEGERIFKGILLAFLSTGLLGILFATTILPFIAEKITNSVYDSSEEVEPDPFTKARVFMAQGEWESAIESFREAAIDNEMNPVPWLEIAKIQSKEYNDDVAAVATLKEAIEGHTWEIDDAAFFMFRLSETYDLKLNNHDAARSVLEQIVVQFPETRHSANAGTKLRNMGEA